MKRGERRRPAGAERQAPPSGGSGWVGTRKKRPRSDAGGVDPVSPPRRTGPRRKGRAAAAPHSELPFTDESETVTFASSSKQRVQKVLARAGLASRRQAEALIAEGRVRIGGKRIDKQGTLVDPRRDSISVDGRRIAPERLTYLLFHKPREVMCTMRDPLGRRSVVDYLHGAETRVVPVGRLDYQTGGVLLLTNDGAFARELLHPSRGVLKEYVLKLKGPVDAAGLERLRERIEIGGKNTKPARVERLRADDNNTWLVVTLQEGKNRQVRRLAEHAGYRVMRLTRTRFAGLTTEGLRPGEWRQLSAAELRSVRSQSKGESESAGEPRPTSGRSFASGRSDTGPRTSKGRGGKRSAAKRGARSRG